MDNDIYIPLDADDIANLNVDQPVTVEEELTRFREQWQRELRETQDNNNEEPQSQDAVRDAPTIEDEAAHLFLQGVSLEQAGKLYEAIKYYQRAVHLVPDIEFRITDFNPVRKRKDRTISETSIESTGSDVNADDPNDLTDLIHHFNRLLVYKDGVCLHQESTHDTHISDLPVEVLVHIFKWVVSSELDVVTLENLALVCRGFFMCARDEEIWRLICTKIWGVNTGSIGNYGSYRNMYINRPHVLYNGCYISKMSYYREGEKGLDNFYKPFHLVEHYRYVRFFPDGQVLMLMTPDDPYSALPKLRYARYREQGIMYGRWRLTGDKVSAILKRRRTENTAYKYRRRKENNRNDMDQIFQCEFSLTSTSKRSNSQLNWNRYSLTTIYRASKEELECPFEINNKSYPPLIFSRVVSFTKTSEEPLGHEIVSTQA